MSCINVNWPEFVEVLLVVDILVVDDDNCSNSLLSTVLYTGVECYLKTNNFMAQSFYFLLKRLQIMESVAFT